jgi:hypothetical protein
MRMEQVICSNVWLQQIIFEHKGDKRSGHSHEFDHIHLLASGSIRVDIEGHTKKYTAPAFIFIAKNARHEFTCLSDESVGYCVHALRNGSRVEDIISPDTDPTLIQEAISTLHTFDKKYIPEAPDPKYTKEL